VHIKRNFATDTSAKKTFLLIIALFFFAGVAVAEAPKEWTKNVDFDSYIGKTVIVNFDYLDSDGKQFDSDEFWGKVVRASAKAGILIRNPRTGEEWNSPPFSLKPMNPGVYRLRSTGEEIGNPDYEITWDIVKPPKNSP
jgi:hypothetical protein